MLFLTMLLAIVIMTLIGIYLGYFEEKHKHEKKLEKLNKIIKEGNLTVEQAEKLYDLFMD